MICGRLDSELKKLASTTGVALPDTQMHHILDVVTIIPRSTRIPETTGGASQIIVGKELVKVIHGTDSK